MRACQPSQRPFEMLGIQFKCPGHDIYLLAPGTHVRIMKDKFQTMPKEQPSTNSKAFVANSKRVPKAIAGVSLLQCLSSKNFTKGTAMNQNWWAISWPRFACDGREPWGRVSKSRLEFDFGVANQSHTQNQPFDGT